MCEMVNNDAQAISVTWRKEALRPPQCVKIFARLMSA